MTLEVIYTGYRKVTATVDVPAGASATKNFELVSTLQDPSASTTAPDGTVKLQAFTVNSEREGNAKAIMEQKRNMNITTTVASDIFGDVTDGGNDETADTGH